MTQLIKLNQKKFFVLNNLQNYNKQFYKFLELILSEIFKNNMKKKKFYKKLKNKILIDSSIPKTF